MKFTKSLKSFLVLSVLSFASFALAQTPEQKNKAAGWVSGPMLGYVEHKEVLIWLEVRPTVKKVQLRYFPKGQLAAAQVVELVPAPYLGYATLKFKLDNLLMNTQYEYELALDGKRLSFAYPLGFKTKEIWEWRKDAPDFAFQFGSCVYINDSIYDRPGRPYGRSPKILETMANQPADFMIWGGDNLYLREADYSSPSGIAYRYSYNFKIPEMQKLRATRANYAIWDDHDFGPNDSDSKYELKNVSTQVFQNYWGNKTFGEPDNEGAYSKFRWSDVEYFLLDDRYHRAANKSPDSVNGKPNPNKVMFGKKQMEWLKESLIASKESAQTSFRFIVAGGQMFNALNNAENFMRYPAEWQELFDFISENEIEGVVFLSGDRHFSEVLRYPGRDAKAYPLYEFTCSSITSGTWDVAASREASNPIRVNGTLVSNINNFSKISVKGPKKNRSVTIECFDINAKLLFSHTILQSELKVKKK